MTFQDILSVAGSVIVSLGGGAALVWALSSYLGKIWAARILEGDRAKYQQLNLQLQHELDLATRRIQTEIDALGQLHKMRTSEEFSHLAQLWRHLANLNNAYTAVMDRGLNFAPSDPGLAEKQRDERRREFMKVCNEAKTFLYLEEFFVPEHIAEAARQVLKYPDREPFYYLHFRQSIEPEMRIRYEDAQKDYEEFSRELDAIKGMIRIHIRLAGTEAQRHDVGRMGDYSPIVFQQSLPSYSRA